MKRITLLCLVLIGLFSFNSTIAKAREVIDISDQEWTLWLDRDAEWENDPLFLSDTDIADIPGNPPTIGWDKLFAGAVPWQQVQHQASGKNPAIPPITLSLPATVEEYLWDANNGNYKGVSWWGTTIKIPGSQSGKHVVLHFRQGARMRAEVYINEQLAGYNLVSMVPFAVDITKHLRFGKPNAIAIRITDPDGNFGWADIKPHKWGKTPIPPSHGFGGIMGKVEVEYHNDIHVDSLFIKNKPSIKDADTVIQVSNRNDQRFSGELLLKVISADSKRTPVFLKKKKISVQANGNETFNIEISAPQAKIWDIEQPHLYHAIVEVKDSNGNLVDQFKERFGFRWFEVSGHSKGAIFKLNGKRIVLRTAISWGYYPVNGMYATPELARAHVQAAKDVGLNMLSFHRGMGSENVLDMADEIGLLYYAEPGGYTSARKRGANEFMRNWVSEKWLRMVTFMRNHPSLVIYNMINEQANVPDRRNRNDMAAAHRIDPTRIKTYVSGWVEEGTHEPKKLHMLPYDNKQYEYGWFDFHHARGWGTLQNLHYYNPTNFFLRTENKAEIIFYGEDGAIGTPPWLESAVAHYDKIKKNGWDGAGYRSWLNAYNNYLDTKAGWRKAFPSVDGLIKKMGALSHYYQGKAIENVRISDVIDGYAVNGYECELKENHSGIVDAFRNPKDPTGILKHYNQPLYVALKAREKVVHRGEPVLVDAFIVNEDIIKGKHKLVIAKEIAGQAAKPVLSKNVSISGGDTYGELITQGIKLDTSDAPGNYHITAKLFNSGNKLVAQGHTDFHVVDWQRVAISATGAIIDESGLATAFLRQRGVTLPNYTPAQKNLDYVVLVQGNTQFAEIPTRVLQTAKGQKGVMRDVFSGYENLSDLKQSDVVDSMRFDQQSFPFDKTLNLKPAFTLRFLGYLTPEQSGDHQFEMSHNWETKFLFDGKTIMKGKNSVAGGKDGAPPITIPLKAGQKYKVELISTKPFGRPLTHSALKWKTPKTSYDVDGLLKRVKNEGIKLIVMHSPEAFIEALARNKVVKYKSTLRHGHSWKGGIYIVKDHPLVNGMPTNTPMNWQYQLFTRYFGPRHRSFVMTGEQAVIASVSDHQYKVGTAVGIIPYGKGEVLFSTLDIPVHLRSDSPVAHTAKLLFSNFLNWGGGK